jgi:hypothetical protein
MEMTGTWLLAKTSDGEYNMKFTIEVEMEDRWVPHFLGMLKQQERLGNIGSSRIVGIYADGDGDYRPKFKWDDSLPKPAKPRQNDGKGNTVYDAG